MDIGDGLCPVDGVLLVVIVVGLVPRRTGPSMPLHAWSACGSILGNPGSNNLRMSPLVTRSAESGYVCHSLIIWESRLVLLGVIPH